jgi:hypothetical protein
LRSAVVASQVVAARCLRQISCALFVDSNRDAIGDPGGITAKLDYLN